MQVWGGLILSWRSNLSSTSAHAALRGQKSCGRKSSVKKTLSVDGQAGVWHCWSLPLLCLLQSTQHQHFSSTAFTLCLFCCIAKSVHHLLRFIFCWLLVLGLVSFFAAGWKAKGWTLRYSRRCNKQSRLNFWDSFWKPRVSVSFFSFLRFLFLPLLLLRVLLWITSSERHAGNDNMKKHTHTHTFAHTYSIQPLQKYPS